jgi:hypothetical protein
MEDTNRKDERAESREEQAEKLTPSEEIEKIPPEMKRGLEMFFSMQRFIGGPSFPPFLKKINEEHITKILEITEEADKQSFQDASSERKYGFAYFLTLCLVFVSLFIFLTVYLADKDKELYKEILKIGVGFLSGIAAGYGLGVRKRGREES